MKYVILALSLMLTACNIPYSSGERAGTVSKFSYKGLVCKTWEGQLLLGGMKTVRTDNGSVVVANTFEFTVSDVRVVQSIEEALTSGKRVTLKYEQVIAPSPCSSDTGYFITGVQAAE